MLSILGKALKDDSVIELLEHHDVDVVYAFDRLHENMPDIYWASIHSAGVLLRFNEHQILSTIFCHVVARNGFNAVAKDMIGVSVYESFQLAEQACQTDNVPYSANPAKSWLKVLGKDHHTHYEFSNGFLSLVTLMLAQDSEA